MNLLFGLKKLIDNMISTILFALIFMFIGSGLTLYFSGSQLDNICSARVMQNRFIQFFKGDK